MIVFSRQSGGKHNTFTGDASSSDLNQLIINRLQLAPMSLLGTIKSDSDGMFAKFFEQFERIDAGLSVDIAVSNADEYLGQLGLTKEYKGF